MCSNKKKIQWFKHNLLLPLPLIRKGRMLTLEVTLLSLL